jgi:hypothetical protein
MTAARLFSSVVISSLLLGAIPTTTTAEEKRIARPGTSANLRTSIDQAAMRLAHEAPQSTAASGPAGATAKSMQAGSGGGGGGKTAMILTLVGTAAGVGTTVYMVKKLRKTTGETTY